MIEKGVKYPVYKTSTPDAIPERAMLSLDLEQVIAIANVFYYVNKFLAAVPRIFGGIRLSETERSIHKSIHDAAINAALSLEQMHQFKKGEKGGMA
jgi:hypothetical protein